MKQILTLVLLSISISSNGQDVSVVKSVFGIQTGLLGIWGYNEARLSKKISLRTEIGLNAGFWFGSSYEKTGFSLTPVFIAEPRFYYNLAKRMSKSKDITKNSGNFISLQTSYYPDWFVISNYKEVNITSGIAVIPTWGIRRAMGNHFNFETGVGIGYAFYFGKNAAYLDNKSEAAVNLLLRVGYVF